MNNHGIVIDNKILAGKPVIKGTRIAVDFVLELLANGWSYDQIIKNYPSLKKEGILAAIRYSADILKDEKVYATR